MSVKVFMITSESAEPVQVGGIWWDIGDAAGDINGGDFWREVLKLFPDGGIKLKEIRIIPDNPEPICWDEE